MKKEGTTLEAQLAVSSRADAPSLPPPPAFALPEQRQTVDFSDARMQHLNTCVAAAQQRVQDFAEKELFAEARRCLRAPQIRMLLR